MSPVIISLGGSIVIPGSGFDPAFLARFRQLILTQVAAGKRFILVVGGGATARAYQQTAVTFPNLDQSDLDRLGVQATILNAQLVRLLFHDQAYPEVVTDPTIKIETSQPLIIGGGWGVGYSTDKVAVLHAQTTGAKEIFNLTNIDYVYSGDPQTDPTAQRLEKISWADFRDQIVGHDWQPGKHTPFDPVASQLAAELGLRVNILRGTNLEAVSAALAGQPFPGTVVG